MRLISFGLIGLIALTAFFWTEQLTIEQIKTAQLRDYYVEMALSHAAEDAVGATRMAAEDYLGSDGLTVRRPEMAIDAFISSLAYSLNMTAQGDCLRLLNYVPYIVVVDASGYYVYATVPSGGGTAQYRHQLLPRIDFTHKIDDYYIFLGDAENVKIMYRQAGQWRVEKRPVDGWLGLIGNETVRQFLTAPDYQQRIAQLKLAQLEGDLATIVNDHNRYAAAHGLYYDFKFEPIGDSWMGVVERPTFIAALQGLPLANRQHFNKVISCNYSITRQEQYYGFSYNGVKYYAKIGDLPVDVSITEDVFYNPQDAAKQGYYPYKK